jgi:Carboxypeptidase regulatory-like domain
MTRHTRAFLALGTAAVLLVTEVSAGTLPGPDAGAKGASATVLGNAWKADNTPLPNARVRLRNVATARAVATATANESGRFTFNNLEAGSFAVELLNDQDKVIAIGQVFTIAQGETIATFVRLASRAPGLGGLFSNIATTAVTAASSLGVTALGSNGQPVSAAPESGQ